MEKRAVERIPANLSARFFYGNMFYTGTILNLSEKGMFISTRRCLPCESMFVIIIRSESKLMQVVARVKRLAKDNGHYGGMGVELLNATVEYSEFIGGLKENKSFQASV
ncbi:MAG: PilZ domain-containing protein [Nitrospirae bacterium]|nr:PilZ domain-containing protein [Nitrospirota bacterium]